MMKMQNKSYTLSILEDTLFKGRLIKINNEYDVEITRYEEDYIAGTVKKNNEFVRNISSWCRMGFIDEINKIVK